MRSRASSLLRARCLAMASSPPPALDQRDALAQLGDQRGEVRLALFELRAGAINPAFQHGHSKTLLVGGRAKRSEVAGARESWIVPRA